MREPLKIAAIAVAAAVLYAALAPAVVNGDGLGYLNAASDPQAIYPGHLLYLPVLRVLRAIFHLGPWPIDLLVPARIVSHLCAGLAILFIGFSARYVGANGVVAALGMACSFAILGAGSDVESYAPALCALSLALFSLVRARPILCAIGCSLAIGFHIENVLFILPALCELPRKRRLIFLATTVFLVAAIVIKFHPGSFASASHGLHYAVGLRTPVVMLYGMARTLVYSPYLYEASQIQVVICTALGVLALGALIRLAKNAPFSPLNFSTTITWLIPYATVAAVFYASDPERWIFLLPLLWLYVAQRGGMLARNTALALAGANLVLWLPIARNRDWLDRAARTASSINDGDLVISPGHSWDEYVGFAERRHVDHFPLVYFAGQLGTKEKVAAALNQQIERTWQNGHEVHLVRMGIADDDAGWRELQQFGINWAIAWKMIPTAHLADVGEAKILFKPIRDAAPVPVDR